jgi:hypothetical protein
MSARPWLATYGGHISDEIDPDARGRRFGLCNGGRSDQIVSMRCIVRFRRSTARDSETPVGSLAGA